MSRCSQPTPEPSALSPAFGDNFSPHGGKAQGGRKASLWGDLRDTRFREPLLGPGVGEPQAALHSPLAFSSPLSPSPPFPTFLLPASAFSLPPLLRSARGSWSTTGGSYPGEAAGEPPAAPEVFLRELGQEALRCRRPCDAGTAPGAVGSV